MILFQILKGKLAYFLVVQKNLIHVTGGTLVFKHAW